MADLGSLKQRVELVDLRLKTAHGARERESAALMETWEQIRERFVQQTAEIVQLRERISELEDSKDDLLQMVHGLLAAVEGGLERMSDESVPQIRAMANNLLADTTEQTGSFTDALDRVMSNPAPVEASVPAPPPEYSEGNLHDHLLETIEQSIETVQEIDIADRIREPAPQSERNAFETDVIKDAASPGIRDLVARIETAVGPELLEAATTSDTDDGVEDLYVEDLYEGGDELSRDLQEIEALRGELHGLRQRISSGAM